MTREEYEYFVGRAIRLVAEAFEGLDRGPLDKGPLYRLRQVGIRP